MGKERKELELSKLLFRVFLLSSLSFCLLLLFLIGGMYIGAMTGGQALKSFFIVFAIWAPITVIFINSGNSAEQYENKISWRKKDIEWYDNGINAIDKLLALPDDELKKKVNDIGLAKMTVDGIEFKFHISNRLTADDIRESLSSRKESFIEEQKQKRKAIPKEPEMVAFWRKTFSLLSFGRIKFSIDNGF